MINDTTLIAITDRLEMLEAAHPLMYAALRRMTYLADPARLKVDDVNEVLAKIREVAREATDPIDAVTLAEQKRGMELVDADALAQMEGGGGYTALSPKGKLLVIAALKRQERDKAKQTRTNGSDGAQAQADGITSAGTGVPVRTLHLHTERTT